MTYSLVLVDNRFVCLAVVVDDGCLSAIVQEEFCFIQIFLVSCSKIKFCECHFRNLVSGHHASLPLFWSHFTAYAIGILDGDVEKLTASRGLVVGDGRLHHMPQIIELVAEVFFLDPSAVSCPFVRMLWVLCPGGVEISIGLLGSGNDVEHRVDIGFQFLVGECLQNVARPFNGLVGVGIIETVSSHLESLRGVFHVRGGVHKVGVSASLLAFAESKGDGGFAACFKSLSPKRVRRHFYRRERYGSDGVCRACRLFVLCYTAKGEG